MVTREFHHLGDIELQKYGRHPYLQAYFILIKWNHLDQEEVSYFAVYHRNSSKVYQVSGKHRSQRKDLWSRIYLFLYHILYKTICQYVSLIATNFYKE